MIKLFSSTIDEGIIDNFREEYNLQTYFNVVGNLLPREFFISIAAVLSPTFIEFEDCILWLSQKKDLATLSLDPSKDKTENEKYKNVFEIGQFFSWWYQNNVDPSTYTDERDEKDWNMSMEIAKIIEHFWTLKLKQDFPDREFVFEIGDGTEDFYGEYGVCITFYEKIINLGCYQTNLKNL